MNMPRHYALGTLVTVAAFFRDTSNELIDPAVVNFRFRDPTQQETTYVYGVNAELVKDAVGKYHVDIDAIYGRWQYRFYSTGNGQAADENHL
jgi:hypothetical protein